MPYRPSDTRNTGRSNSIATIAVAIQLATVGFAALPVFYASTVAAQISDVQSAEQQLEFSIPAGSLTEVLNQFAAVSGIYLSGNGALTQGKNSVGLNGQFSVEQALTQLLGGAEIKFTRSGKTVTLVDASGNVMMMSPVRVSESALANITEGTQSYTTGSMSTATKLDLSIRETPQSITIITQQRMKDEGIIDMRDVIEKTPGLSISSYGVGRPLFYARGFSLDTVAQDGITSTFSSYIPSPLSNLAMIDRAEIVRGSTGLTQGQVILQQRSI